MASVIEVKHEVEDWDFEENIEIPTSRDGLALNYRDLLTPDSQKVKLSPLQHRRKQREQYRSNVNSLRELAAILPVPLQKREKRLTKKEILNQVLRYIAFLNRHICNAKSLLKNHYVAVDESEYYLNGEDSTSQDEAAQRNTDEISPPSTPPSIKKMRLRNICPKPRKKKWVEKTERRHVLKSRRRLYSEPALRDNFPRAESQREVKLTWQGPSLDTSSSSSCSQDNTVRPPGLTLFLTLLELAESRDLAASALRNTGNETNNDPKGSSEKDERKFSCSYGSSMYDPPVNSLCLSMKDQKLVHYLSSHDEDDDIDRSPWLPQESPQGGAEIHSPISGSLATSGLQATLGLSPSLFSSPGRHVQLLQDKKENLAQALFGAVCLSPELPATRPGDLKLSNPSQNQHYPNGYRNLTSKGDPDQIVPATPPVTSDSFQSTFIFDHCYLPCSETSRTDSSQADSTSSGDNSCQICPSLEKWDRHLLQEDSDESERWLSSSDDMEDSDITWTPYCRGKFFQQTILNNQKRTKIISPANHSKIRRKRCCALQLKKKCVNGFIMFCRINRRLYISDHPGTASTVATKALAHVWRTMSKNERRPYCIKAREFSKKNNRIVRLDSSSSEEREEVEMPEPLHLL
ncbi:meiosis initiator protein-like isoform X1 [Scyliorhinus canicula]|uniref:meiosis initiator protein-like isoform X1 n=1 Tax=Scyliorhinus canicula TaxID=7830 RepID=UPI0018F7AF83|nr:meiosis initiator protein-like isoform X1 [Scyliorhinus canicula]XP_038641852.1 meiosis initiator protein-like isoform X1 [Scyliorhinus canicula]XP_038641853.1 meiosis initiator protein-like isoform X1 [Scyliorhinus canicula]